MGSKNGRKNRRKKGQKRGRNYINYYYGLFLWHKKYGLNKPYLWDDKIFQTIKKCPEPESNQWHEDFQSSALPTELSGHWVAGTGFEPMTFGLWARRASRLLHPALYNCDCSILWIKQMDGEGFEPSKAVPTDLQSAPFGHSGIPPYKADIRTRTENLLITSQLLCQLSHIGTWSL